MSYIPVYSTRINWENEPSIVSPINATNLNKMDYALKAHDDTLANWDITKANESDLLLALKEVSYDTDTGVFVFTWFNGTTATIDLNIEKIPVSFSMDANGVITMTTEDGTTYTADVGALIKTYTFTDSSVIDFTVTTDASGNKTVTADIVDGSIDGTKLTPNYLADCTQAKTGAETAATNSAASSQDAESWAVGTRGGVPVPSTDPAYENNAEYWAHHTSSSLAGLSDVDLNNPSDGEVLKYNGTTSKWENGQAAAGGGSTIAVSTSESALYGQNVTLTDGVTTLTGAFDNTGHATFSGVTMTGNLTIACGTASTSLNVPYFGNYTAVVSSFSASITVTYPGGTCTCVGNGESYTASSSPYTFTVHGAATYTITVTIDGVSKTDTVVITTDGQTETSTIEFGTINVTYENDFKGVSITCTLGATTITKTAPTTGNTMSFYPPTTGQWTISGTVGGVPYPITANVTSLSTPVSVNLETIPDGSTATPTDDIQIWLKCAGITDKSYTTLNEVLADSVTYNALLGDSNACAYMKRSTTWSTDICTSQYAMNLLGQYDTACDALLSDATWASAITNSTYFESVLNVKVPVMTSDTTPSGEASASSTYSGAPAYRAFDGTSNDWATAQNQTTNQWIKYAFTEPVCIKAVTLTTHNGRMNHFKIQGSSDNFVSDINDLYEGTAPSTTSDMAFTISNNDSYRYYRCFIIDVHSDAYAGLNELQFYGRTTSSEKIHGGNPTYDSFYRIVDGNHVPVTDPSLLDAGTYTIYSNGLAKNPDDLSADYGKTVRICPNTKEIVVRPDNAIYWYGSECGSGGFTNENINASSQSMTKNSTSFSVTATNGAMHCYPQRAFNTAHCTKLLGHIDVTGSGNGSGGFLSSPTKTGNPASNEYGRYSSTMPFSGVGDVTLTNTGDVYTHIYVSLGNITATQVTYALWYE